MKKKIPVIFPILCILLVLALAVSFLRLRSVQSDVAELEKQIAELAAENQQLSSINLALQLQVDSLTDTPSGDSYCSLFVDSWSVKNNILSVQGLAQAVFPRHLDFTAKIEIWKNDEVLSSQDISLTTDGADPVYESQVTVKFEIPEVAPGEELELWLMVAPESGTPLFSCGAGWYLENSQMMIIAG